MTATKYGALFAQCAAPEAIAAELRKAVAAKRSADRRVEWLLALRAERLAQVATGAWPPPRNADSPGGDR